MDKKFALLVASVIDFQTLRIGRYFTFELFALPKVVLYMADLDVPHRRRMEREMSGKRLHTAALNTSGTITPCEVRLKAVIEHRELSL